MKKELFGKDVFNVITPNVVENDLLYFAAVMSRVADVVSKTYGPWAGYTAQAQLESNVGKFTYTKDGMQTLLRMGFEELPDRMVLGMARILANKIKDNSGDGSTTGAKILSNMLTKAARDIYATKDLDGVSKGHYLDRITSPKATEVINKLLKEVYEENTNKVNRYEDILDIAYIALNNDEELLKPYVEIVNHMKENKIELDEDVEIATFRSPAPNTTVEFTPGFKLGPNKLLVRGNDNRFERCKPFILANNITIDMMKYVVEDMVDMANELGRNTGYGTLFIIGDMDNESKNHLAKLVRKFAENNEPLYCDFYCASFAYSATDDMRKDLAYRFNTNYINLMEYIEKRAFNPMERNDTDTPDNNTLAKWKAAVDENGKVVDTIAGLSKFYDDLEKIHEKAVPMNVKFTPGIGITATVINDGVNRDMSLYEKHIEELKAIADNVNDYEQSTAAKARLHNFRDKNYTILTEMRPGNEDRLYHAYNDASRAINSSLKYGYHMGGSMGALQKINSLIGKLKQLNNDHIRECALYIVSLLKESYEDVVDELLLGDTRRKDAVIKGDINEAEMTFYGVKVINPVMTDAIIMEVVLAQFVNLYSSLAIEFQTYQETFYVERMTKLIKENIEEGKDIHGKKAVNTPVKVQEVFVKDGKEFTIEDIENNEDLFEEISDEVQADVVVPEIEEVVETPYEDEPIVEVEEIVPEPVEEVTQEEEPYDLPEGYESFPADIKAICEIHPSKRDPFQKQMLDIYIKSEQDKKKIAVQKRKEELSRVTFPDGDPYADYENGDLDEALEDLKTNEQHVIGESNGVKITMSLPKYAADGEVERLKKNPFGSNGE